MDQINPTVQNNPEPQPGPNHRNLWIIAGVVALLLIAGAVFWLTKKETPTEDTQNQVNDSASSNWKTYTNSQFGYEIRHPNDWAINSPSDDVHLQSQINCDRSQSCTVIEIQAFHTKPSNVSLLNHVKSEHSGEGLGSGDNFTSVSFNGYDAVKSSIHGGEGSPGPGYFIEKNSTMYFNILVYSPESDPDTEMVLSTFKFIQ